MSAWSGEVWEDRFWLDGREGEANDTSGGGAGCQEDRCPRGEGGWDWGEPRLLDTCEGQGPEGAQGEPAAFSRPLRPTPERAAAMAWEREARASGWLTSSTFCEGIQRALPSGTGLRQSSQCPLVPGDKRTCGRTPRPLAPWLQSS